MATKNSNLPDKSNISFGISTSDNNSQYSNLNLNQTVEHSTKINENSVHSKNISKNNIENRRKNIDLNNSLQSNNGTSSLKSFKPLEKLNLYGKDEEEERKAQKKSLNKFQNSNNNNSNNSTLSLHIAAYENSIEATNLNKNFDNKISTKKPFGKSWKSAKDILIHSSTNIQSPFELPRQQREFDRDDLDPEIMQFKASQRLFNPNELNAVESGELNSAESDSARTITIEDDENDDDKTLQPNDIIVVEKPIEVITLDDDEDENDKGQGQKVEEQNEIEEGEIVESIKDLKIEVKSEENALPTTETMNTASEAFVLPPPITMNEEPQMPHYENITEQMPEDDFVTTLLSQMGRQFCAEPVVQPIRLRIPPSTINTALERVEAHRVFKIGNDKRGKSQARVWIDTPEDDTKVFLYRHSEQYSDENKDVFVCIQCSRHSRVTKFEIRRLENGQLELWEQPTHYPSCYRSKPEIEDIQARYDRKGSMNGILNGTLNGSLNGTLNGTLNGALNGSAVASNENSFNTSARNNPAPSRAPGRPKNDYHYSRHRIVPETDYIFGVNEKGSLKTRVLVRDEYNRNLGRVYSFHPAKRADGRTIFYCRHCNPKKYVPITVGDEAGEFTVREAPLDRHEPSCEPIPFDELIEKQHQLEEKLQRRGISILDFSNFNENGDETNHIRSRARSPTIALRSREATQSPSIDDQQRRTTTRASRSRSRSPMNVVTSNTSLASLLNTSGGGSARRGRRPDKSLMRIVSNHHWRCDSPNDPGTGSRLLIFTDLDTAMGREFHFCEFGLDGGAYYNCQQCLRLTANRQRTKGYVAIETNGHIEVREGRHYPTCKPFVLQNIPPPLPQNELDDEVPMEVVVENPIPVVKINRSPVKAPTAPIVPVEESSPSLSPELGQTSSSSASSKRRDDTEPLPTPPPAQQIKQPFISNSSSIATTGATAAASAAAQTINFAPQVLTKDKIVFYNVPSSSQMRNASKILGVEYNKDGHVFWNNTLQWISEFCGTSRPSEIRPITMQRFSGFAALAIFVTGNEEYSFEIQQAIKTYFYQNFVTGKNCNLSEDVVLETLVSNELTDIHLSIFSRMINCIVGVFDGPLLKIYGSSDDEQSPTMLLRKNGKVFSPVVRINP